MVSIGRSPSGSGAGRKKEVEGGNKIDDDVALTFPQRVSNDMRMDPLGPILSNYRCVCEFPALPFSMLRSNEDS